MFNPLNNLQPRTNAPAGTCSPPVRCFCLLALVLATGCSPAPEAKRLIGVWELESGDRLAQRLGQTVGSTSSDINSGRTTGDSAGINEPNGFDSAADEGSTMRIEFQKNGSLKTLTALKMINPTPKLGNWTLVASDDSGQTITVECQLLGQRTEHEIRFIDDDTIEMVPPNMAGTTQKLRFRRASQ